MRAKLVKEALADKYVKQDPYLAGVPSDHEEFEKKYTEEQERKRGEIFYKDKNVTLVKNPQSLDNFKVDARGVILPSGDTFIELTGHMIHPDIIKILKDKKLVPETTSDKWARLLPSQNKFLTIIRIGKSNTMCIGPSNRAIYDAENYKKYINDFNLYLNKAKEKCKNIVFSNKVLHKIYGLDAKEDHFAKPI